MRLQTIIKCALNYLSDRFLFIPLVFLWINNTCNARCIMCDYWKINNREQLNFNEIQQLITALLKLKLETVVLTGGEPLVHPEFIDICKWLKKNKIRITLCTNGILLKRFVREISECIDSITVSLDGGIPDIHNRIRDIDCFEDILAGVKTIREQKSTIKIMVRCTIQKANYSHFSKVIDIAKMSAANCVSFVPVCTYPGIFVHRNQANGEISYSDLELNEEELDKFRNEIESVIKLYNKDFQAGFVLTTPKKMRRLHHYLAVRKTKARPLYSYCILPWVSLVIKPNGEILPCFFKECIGNFRRESLETILRLQQLSKLHSNIRNKYSSICQICPAELMYIAPR